VHGNVQHVPEKWPPFLSVCLISLENKVVYSKVLLSWQAIVSSPSSFDECTLSAWWHVQSQSTTPPLPFIVNSLEAETVKTLMFACPLFHKFQNKTTKLKGANINAAPTLIVVLELCFEIKIKNVKCCLHVKSLTFRVAKLKHFTVLMDCGRLNWPRHSSKSTQPCMAQWLPTVRFKPGFSHATVTHVTTRPLRPVTFPVSNALPTH